VSEQRTYHSKRDRRRYTHHPCRLQTWDGRGQNFDVVVVVVALNSALKTPLHLNISEFHSTNTKTQTQPSTELYSPNTPQRLRSLVIQKTSMTCS